MIERIDDEDAIMIVIDRKAPWILELAWLVTSLAELGHEREAFIIIITREYLHSMIERISDHQEISMMVERQASRFIEQAIITALFAGANRELDSSIDIITVRLIEMIAHDCNTNSTNTKTIYSADHSNNNNNKISID